MGKKTGKAGIRDMKSYHLTVSRSFFKAVEKAGKKSGRAQDWEGTFLLEAGVSAGLRLLEHKVLPQADARYFEFDRKEPKKHLHLFLKPETERSLEELGASQMVAKWDMARLLLGAALKAVQSNPYNLALEGVAELIIRQNAPIPEPRIILPGRP